MVAKAFTADENKRLIVLFFKQIGLYAEFKKFMDDQTIKVSNKFRFHLHSNPISAFGDTTISYHLRDIIGYRLTDDNSNLYDIFKAWLYAFYPEEYQRAIKYRAYGSFSPVILERWIDMDKRIFKMKINKCKR